MENHYTETIAFLYANNENSEREIKESIPFSIETKRIKYVGINLPYETKDLYTQNYKTVMTEIKDDIKRWRDIPCSWVGRIDIVKMNILPNRIFRLNVIPIKLSMAFCFVLFCFYRTRTKNFTIHMETQTILNSQSSLEKEEWSWRNQPSWLQIILQSCSQQKYRSMEHVRKPRNKPMHLWVP